MTMTMEKPQEQQQATRVRPPQALEIMAQRLQVSPQKLFESLAATVFAGATNEEMLALVVTANQYGLNPFLKQIYAFPKKGGGIVPIVGVDGWAAIINSQETFDGCEFLYENDDDAPIACTCIIYVKQRNHPIKVTEYYVECKRNTEPWNAMPRRMLRHKAFMQAGRLAFGLGGIFDEDEGRDVAAGVIGNSGATAVEMNMPRPTRTERMAEQMQKDAPQPTQQAAPEAEKAPATLSWEQLANQGITSLAEDDGIAVQNADGLTLRPDGTWSDQFTGKTVGAGPESDQIAREMATKALATMDAAPQSPASTPAAADPKATTNTPPADGAAPAPPAPRKSNRPGPNNR